MGLLALPNEILFLIADRLPYSWDLNSFAQLNRRLYSLLNSHLYQRNICQSESSALQWAAKHGRASAVRKALDEGADPNTTAIYPWKPFADAAAQGHDDVVRVFLEKGFDPNPTTGWGRTKRHHGNPLWLAVTNRQEAVARLLIEHGADPNALVQGKTCLHGAAMNPRLSIVKFLVDGKYCDVNAVDGMGYTPLVYAAQAGSDDVVRCLLQNGADPNIVVTHRRLSVDVTAISFAALKGYIEVIQTLIDHGAEPNLSLRPMCIALAENQYDAACLLLRHTNLRELPTSENEQGILLCAAAACNSEPLVRRLLDNGCSPEARQGEEAIAFPTQGAWTALVWAARLGHENIASLLLERGADPDSKKRLPPSPRPLQMAIRKEQEHIVNLLLEHGADPNYSDGASIPPLFNATLHEGIFKALLEHGADPFITDNQHGMTPLIVTVVMSGNTNLARILFERGIKFEISPDNDPPQGRYLLQPATVGGFEMLKLMFEHGVKTPDPDSSAARFAIDTAISNGNAAALELLFERGFTAIGLEDLAFCFERAVELDDKDKAAKVLDVLVDHDFDIDARDNERRTCLWPVIYRRDDRALKLLLDRGANPFSVDIYGHTPFCAIAERDFNEGFGLLLDAAKVRGSSREELQEVLSTAESRAAEIKAWKTVKVLQRAQVDLAESRD